MKKGILIAVLLVSKMAISQTINLGKDTTFCSSQTLYKIGDKLSITGSNVGMQYQWSCKYVSRFVNLTLTASDILDNVTLPNPTMVNVPSNNEWIKFVLTATQGANTYKDSINVRVSQKFQTLGYYSKDLNFGDSTLLSDINSYGGGISPLSFVG